MQYQYSYTYKREMSEAEIQQAGADYAETHCAECGELCPAGVLDNGMCLDCTRNQAPRGATHYDPRSLMYLQDRFNGRGVAYWCGEQWLETAQAYPPESAIRL